jgi:hypothetical protein
MGMGEMDEADPLGTAHHEAAHAVVAYRASGFANSCSIVANPVRGSLGHAIDGSSDSTTPNDIEAFCLSLYAGGHAQREFDSRTAFDGCGGDDDDAAEWLERTGWKSREAELRERSLALVRQHWEEICAVARELVQHHQLDGTEVEIIADTVTGVHEQSELERYRRLRRGGA